jgi:hypothetical protein
MDLGKPRGTLQNPHVNHIQDLHALAPVTWVLLSVWSAAKEAGHGPEGGDKVRSRGAVRRRRWRGLEVEATTHRQGLAGRHGVAKVEGSGKVGSRGMD